jgi:hypothetical protein
MKNWFQLVLVVFCALSLAGCASALPHRAPPPDPPGDYVQLTQPIIALGDTQEHESTGFPLHDNDSAVDSYVEVAQRPPEQPLFGRRLLEWAIESDPKAPVIHLGDVLDMSCESELERLTKIFATTRERQPLVILPGNHDGLMFGIFNYDILGDLWDANTSKWGRGCLRGNSSAASLTESASGAALTKRGFIIGYLDHLAGGPHSHLKNLNIPAHGDAEFEWRNPDPAGFIEAIEGQVRDKRDFGRSFIAQKLRMPAAPGAPLRVTVIALDTNQVSAVVKSLDAVRGVSPGTIGRVQREQMDVVAKWVAQARSAGEIVVFAGHHDWDQIGPTSHVMLSEVMEELDHPLVYVSAHTHRGFWAMHKTVSGRNLLELNVSSLSDWPIAYRKVTFYYDAGGSRIKVVADLMPNLGKSPKNDSELLLAWSTVTCADSGVLVDPDYQEDFTVVKAQKDRRGSLVEWAYAALVESCDTCEASLYNHAHEYQDLLLDTIRQTRDTLAEDEPALHTLPLPEFCAGTDLSLCISELQQAQRADVGISRALFRKKAQLVDVAGSHLDKLTSPRAKAYMTCRAVLAAKDDFDLTPDDRNAHRGEAVRQAQEFFRTEATVGM